MTSPYAHLGLNSKMQSYGSPLNTEKPDEGGVAGVFNSLRAKDMIQPGEIHSGQIAKVLQKRTLVDRSGAAVVDEYGLVNSTQVITSSVSKTEGFNQTIGTVTTPLEDGTITFILERPTTIAFFSDVYCYFGGTAANPWTSVILPTMNLDGTAIAVGQCTGSQLAVMGTTGLYSYFGAVGNPTSVSMHWVEPDIAAGTHSYVIKAVTEYKVGAENGVIYYYRQSLLKTGF